MEESDDEIQEESTEQRYIVFPQRERKTERQKKKQKEAKFLVSTFILKSWKTLIHYLSHPIKKVTNIETAGNQRIFRGKQLGGSATSAEDNAEGVILVMVT